MATASSDPPTAELLAAHDDQVRGSIERRLPAGWHAHRYGRLLLVRTQHRGFVFSDGLPGVAVRDVADDVARSVDFFGGHRESFEWKTYGHDNSALPAALENAGFVAEPTETVMIARAHALAAPTPVPGEITIRNVVGREDFTRIASMESHVWGDDWSWLADDLTDRRASDPSAISVYVAEAAGRVVSAAWLVVLSGTRFAGLWGGSTVSEWRGRGIYRALVSVRAAEAIERGIEYLWVDASDASRPILQRLGMSAVTTTTPWVWTPAT